MAALSSGHVEETLLFVSGRDDEPLRAPVRRSLDPGHVRVSGKLARRHVEKAREEGHRAHEWMSFFVSAADEEEETLLRYTSTGYHRFAIH
jgi:hypothetical protein